MKMKKYSTATVAKATGLSESTITAYASQHKFSTKGGITFPQIVEIMNAPRRNRKNGVNEEQVQELRRMLRSVFEEAEEQLSFGKLDQEENKNAE